MSSGYDYDTCRNAVTAEEKRLWERFLTTARCTLILLDRGTVNLMARDGKTRCQAVARIADRTASQSQ